MDLKIGAIVSLVFVIGLFIGSFLLGGITGRFVTISPQEAADKALKFINENLVQSGTEATLVSIKELSNFYNITISYQGKEIPILITKDGNYLLPQIIDMTETSSSNNEQQQANITIVNDPQEGSDGAKLTIVEFSDFQCPYCANFWKNTLPQIKQNYIDTGKVKFVYKNFPLSFHDYAQTAAEAAECAFEQGKFWEYHDKLYANQNALDNTSLKQYAVDLGLDSTKFNSCFDSGKYLLQVQQDEEEGVDAGVTGTPAFFILDSNGKIVKSLTGAQPYSAFQESIDSLLNV